jgi:hypothetical protein
MGDDNNAKGPDERSRDNDGASAPGVAFAYEAAKWQIEKQEQALREVNARLAFLIAGLLGLSTYYFKELHADKDPISTLIFGCAIGVPALLAGIGYTPRGYTRPPYPRAVAEEALKPAGAIKEMLLGTMLKAFDINQEVIRRKAALFAIALVFALLGWFLGIGYKVADASRTLILQRTYSHGSGVGNAGETAGNAERSSQGPPKVRASACRGAVHAKGTRGR